MRISTKKGDKGFSRLLSGEKLSKDDIEFEFLGTLDELQAWIGVLEIDVETKTRIQDDLYKIMGGQVVEPWFDTDCPSSGEFIRPTSWINVARTVARRAERVAVRHGNVHILPYLNRLSDYLYKLDLQNLSENGL